MSDVPRAPYDLTAITFDADWAPDWAIELCAEMCAAANVPATFFVTHGGPALDSLRGGGLFELGIHPNFLPGSSHGADIRAVLDHCLALVPEATALRSHCLVQSTLIFECIADCYPSLATDVSLLLLGHAALHPFRMPFGNSARQLTRIPYFWEDDVAAIDERWSWTQELPPSSGLKVAAFHPIHVALNTATLDDYRALRRATAGRPLHAVGLREARPFVRASAGTRTFLESLLAAREKHRFVTISQIPCH